MSRWGNFTWGDGTIWGADVGDALAWGVEVDWDGDGQFDGSNESGRLLDLQTFRGRRAYLNPGGTGFVSVETGSAEITLDNTDGRYDAWNTASPLYPNVTDGREVRLRVIDLLTGVTSPVFYGTITDIRASNYQDDPTVVLRLEDGWRNLRKTPGRVAMQQNINPDAAIGLVLTAAKWPASWGRTLGASSDNIRYFWSSGDVMAATELERLAQSFLGYFFIDAKGAARYVTRGAESGSKADFLQDLLLKDIALAQPWENRRNITRIKVHPLTASGSVTLWQLTGSVPSITSGTPLTLWANYMYNGKQVPGISITTPVPTTDWTANAASDGSGADKTGDVTLSFSNLGDTAKLVFSYSGGGTIYLTTAKIRGVAVYEVNATDVTYPVDTSAVASPREFVIDLPWQQDVNAALDFVRVLGPHLDMAHPFPQVKIDGRPELQFGVELFDPVSLDIPRIGIEGVSFLVAGIGHRSMGSCQRIQSTYWLEPYIASGTYWTWPITNFGVDTVFGW